MNFDRIELESAFLYEIGQALKQVTASRAPLLTENHIAKLRTYTTKLALLGKTNLTKKYFQVRLKSYIEESRGHGCRLVTLEDLRYADPRVLRRDLQKTIKTFGLSATYEMVKDIGNIR